MKIADKPFAAEKKPGICPVAHAVLAQSFQLKMARADRVTFGMAVNWKSGCCVEKVKTGREGGCCAHIPHARFVGHYREAVLKETEKTGIKPELDPEVQAILDAQPLLQTRKIAEPTRLQTKKEAKSIHPAQARKQRNAVSEPIWQRAMLAPIRWLKWLLLGFWEDLKLLFATGRKA